MYFLGNSSKMMPFRSMMTLWPKMATEYISHICTKKVARGHPMKLWYIGFVSGLVIHILVFLIVYFGCRSSQG